MGLTKNQARAKFLGMASEIEDDTTAVLNGIYFQIFYRIGLYLGPPSFTSQ